MKEILTEKELGRLPDNMNKDKLVAVFKDAVALGFGDKPAAIYHHHNYRGGLDVHTAEVIGFLRELNATVGMPFSLYECVAAGLLHDLGKLWTYNIDEGDFITIDKTVACSEEALVFSLCAGRGLVLSMDLLSAVEFAHGGWSIQIHGKAKPSRLAMLLHSADLLSANFGKVTP